MTAPTTAVQPTDQITAAIGPALDVYNRLQVIKSVLAPDLNDLELQLFAMVADRSHMDPFAKQIYAIKRKGRVTFQTGIDGFRSSAEDTGEYRGSDEPTYGQMVEKPFPHPESATVVVHRQFANGEWLHQSATAYWDEFYPGEDQGFQWRKMPRVMLAKCAEAASFRKAFPKRFADVYTAEEMDQADAADTAKPVGPTAAERIAVRRAEHEAAAAGTSTASEPPTATKPTPVCQVRSPRNATCSLNAGHEGDHKRGNVKWPTPNEKPDGSAAAGGQDHGEDAAGASSEAAGASGSAPADLTQAAQEVFEGEFVESNTCDLVPPVGPGGMTKPCEMPKGHPASHRSSEGSWPA